MYSIHVRAATKELVKQALADAFDSDEQVSKDYGDMRDAILDNASEVIGFVPDDSTMDIAVSIGGGRNPTGVNISSGASLAERNPEIVDSFE